MLEHGLPAATQTVRPGHGRGARCGAGVCLPRDRFAVRVDPDQREAVELRARRAGDGDRRAAVAGHRDRDLVVVEAFHREVVDRLVQQGHAFRRAVGNVVRAVDDGIHQQSAVENAGAAVRVEGECPAIGDRGQRRPREGFGVGNGLGRGRRCDREIGIALVLHGGADRGIGDVIDIHHYPDPRCPEPEQYRASVLGEFGGLGLYLDGHTWEEKNWGYKKMSDADSLLIQYRSFYEIINGMRNEKGLAACVYTQTTDVETETNGLMTYDREVLKMDVEALFEINSLR